MISGTPVADPLAALDPVQAQTITPCDIGARSAQSPDWSARCRRAYAERVFAALQGEPPGLRMTLPSRT